MFNIPEEEITRGWGVWLKASVLQLSGSGFNPWLHTNQGQQLEMTSGGFIMAERRRIGAEMAQENRAKPTDQGHNEQLAVVTDERVSLNEVEEGGKVLQVRVIAEEDDKQLLADRKKRKAGPSLEAQVSTMALDKLKVDDMDMQLSPNPTNQDKPLLVGPIAQVCPFQ